MKKWIALALFVIALSVAACGGPAPAGSCSATSGGVSYCISYTGTSATMSAIQQGCTSGMGTYQSTDCPTANRVGRCTLPGGNAELTQTANYYAPTTAEQAMAACTAIMGTFAAN